MDPLLSDVIHVTLYKVKMKVMNYFKVHEPSNKGNNSHWYKRLKFSSLSKVIIVLMNLFFFTALNVSTGVTGSPYSSAIGELLPVYPTIVI